MSARVLVVDDVLPNVKLLQAKLSREYYDVVTAYSGAEALQAIADRPPDIVLLDVMMPGMDGFEVCSRIRANPATAHIPVVMVSALSDAADRVRGLEAGADDFLTKPVNDLALFSRVRSLTRLKMMMDEWHRRESTGDQLGVLGMDDATQDDGRGARILAVEDSRTDRMKISEGLARDRHVTEFADDPTRLLELVRELRPDLAIVSLTLLDGDGLRLVSQLRSAEETRTVPILAMADEGDVERVAKALELGAHDYLLKPIDRNELLARCRTNIRRKRWQERLRHNLEESLSLALTDPLTGAFNRRYLDNHLPRLLSTGQSEAKPVSLLALDIDRFKSVNDTYGHAAGDAVLREIGHRLGQTLRSVDAVARIGGEEFVAALPGTDVEEALTVAERVRAVIAAAPFALPDGTALAVTVSVGVAVAPAGRTVTAAVLLREADEALYTAKAEGRDCVRLASGHSPLVDRQNQAQEQGQPQPRTGIIGAADRFVRSLR